MQQMLAVTSPGNLHICYSAVLYFLMYLQIPRRCPRPFGRWGGPKRRLLDLIKETIFVPRTIMSLGDAELALERMDQRLAAALVSRLTSPRCGGDFTILQSWSRRIGQKLGCLVNGQHAPAEEPPPVEAGELWLHYGHDERQPHLLPLGPEHGCH